MNLHQLIEENDLSGRSLREVQKLALSWIQGQWGDNRHLAISLPVGSGKSLIARSLQLATGAAIVTPSNTLVRQYINTYKNLPHYIGKEHYRCKDSGFSCAHKQEQLHFKPCEYCPYSAAREAVGRGDPCVFNPISLLQARRGNDFRNYPVTIIDEAHSVLSLLQTLNEEKVSFTSKTLKSSFGINHVSELLNEIYLVEFLKKELARKQNEYEDQADGWTITKRIRRSKKIATFENLIDGISEAPENYAIHLEDSAVVIRGARIPRSLIKRVFGHTRFVLLSATLFRPDLVEIFDDEPYDYLDLPSPIAKERRPIFYTPTSFSINHQTDPRLIAAELDALLVRYPGINTLIHMPYSLASQVFPHLKTQVFTHTPDNKETQLRAWMHSGGVFLGSGVYEGIDLYDDLCRLNIIVKIPYPNLGDILVRKRKALNDGNLWYASQSLKAVIQSVGRSTRGEKDYSDTYILDPSFAGLVNKNYNWLPKSFTESIIWSGNAITDNR